MTDYGWDEVAQMEAAILKVVEAFAGRQGDVKPEQLPDLYEQLVKRVLEVRKTLRA